MSKVTRTDVQHQAELSQLSLSADEIDALQKDMTTILDYVEKLDELDTASVEPTYQVNHLENVWRDDVVVASDVSREDLLALALASQDSQIKVPKVL